MWRKEQEEPNLQEPDLKRRQGLGCLREQWEVSQEGDEQMSLLWRYLQLVLNLQ